MCWFLILISIRWGGMFWMIDFERLGMVVNVLELMGIDWVWRLFGTPSDSYLIQLVTWEDEQFQVAVFFERGRLDNFFTSNEWLGNFTTFTHMPRCATRTLTIDPVLALFGVIYTCWYLHFNCNGGFPSWWRCPCVDLMRHSCSTVGYTRAT